MVHAGNLSASCHWQCSKIVRADCGELQVGVWNRVELRLRPTSRQQQGSDQSSIGIHPPYPSPTRTFGIDLSDLIDFPVALDNIPECLARNSDEHHRSTAGMW